MCVCQGKSDERLETASLTRQDPRVRQLNENLKDLYTKVREREILERINSVASELHG
jgi:hypothetical protein